MSQVARCGWFQNVIAGSDVVFVLFLQFAPSRELHCDNLRVIKEAVVEGRYGMACGKY